MHVPHNLVLVGKRDGFITKDIEVNALVETMGHRVKMTGELDDQQVRKLVAGADLLVLPSLYEGFGLPIVEAMACGCPVLAANTSSLPEVGGDAVAYCDPFSETDIAEKLLLLLSNDERRRELSGAGLKRARLFDWDQVVIETAHALISSTT